MRCGRSRSFADYGSRIIYCRASLYPQSLFSYQRPVAGWANAKLAADSVILHQLVPLVKTSQYHICDFCFRLTFREPLRLAHFRDSTRLWKPCQDLAVCRFSVSRFSIGNRSGRRHSQDLTTTLNRCQDPAVSRFSVRRLETAWASRLAQVVYHNLEGLSRPRSITFCSITFSVRRLWNPRRFPASTLRAYHSLKPLSSPCSITFPFIRERRN